ncbi:MAG: VOC family protein [Actinomycetota bacterium]|nr:VOC family protein [Actinomycetota bacterium]
MSRVQLALNVSDVDAAVDFYRKLFGVEPAKRRPGYANFAVADPPLKLVLIESGSARASGVGGALNHLGIEVGAPSEVGQASARLTEAGLETAVEEKTTCCYALQDKVWVRDPDGAPWEVYAVLADAVAPESGSVEFACCGGDATARGERTPAVLRAANP